MKLRWAQCLCVSTPPLDGEGRARRAAVLVDDLDPVPAAFEQETDGVVAGCVSSVITVDVPMQCGVGRRVAGAQGDALRFVAEIAGHEQGGARRRIDDPERVVGPLKERGIDPSTADPAQMAVTYWNGSAWQPEVCTIPEAEVP